MTPQQFIAKWGPGGPAFDLNERQGAQAHFMDLCELLGVPTPGSLVGNASDYIFEQDTLVLGEARGYADVFYRDHFAWENKAPGKNLDAALKQLLTYSLALSNPPLLVVCDRLTLRIHTQFNGHPSETHTVLLHELAQPEKLALLRRIWLDTESFRPKKTSRDITEAAAKSFATLADGLRKRGPGTNDHADEVAHFLTQCLFCFFAEDVGLLPGRMFEGLVKNKALTSDRLVTGLDNLFTVMRDGGLYGNDEIPWFNGGLFKHIKVPTLTILDMTELRNAAALNWSAIDVSIFGTLFERGLDPAKRSQLGAHYTDPATIMRIVEPVLIRHLLQKWELVKHTIQGLLAKSIKKDDARYKAAKAEFVLWLEDLKNYRVLDPACGSGNFLFMGLKALKDVEHKSHLDAARLGLDRQADLVTGPHNVLGIELNEYAAELARVTVWIGELQWRMAHGYEFKTNPVLEPLDHIECRDALLTWPGPSSGHTGQTSFRPGLVEGVGATPGARAGQRPGAQHPADALIVRQTSAPPTPLSDRRGGSASVRAEPVEASWPRASVVIGNPPFLGGSKKRGELGDAYFEALARVFKDRVPAGADLVCYWFDKAREQIKHAGLGAAGLVATQSIRAGSNRQVLDAVVRETRIFDAWADEAWINDGAAVRVSLISFGWGDCCFLDGQRVEKVTAELGSGAAFDMTTARPLVENLNVSFEGTKKYGEFDIPGQLARRWLRLPNPHGLPNSNVVKPWRNGQDLSRRPSDTWIIDFGSTMEIGTAALYEAPFAHVEFFVKPERLKAQLPDKWWMHERSRAAMRGAVKALPRYIATVRVSKHRYFVFLDTAVLPDTRLNAIARADDTTFGILSSRIHEVWSLAQASMHGVGNDPTYNAKSCFETFPFPAGLTPADTAHQHTETVEGGAVIPADMSEQNSPIAPVKYAHADINTVAHSASRPVQPQPGKAGAGRRSGAASNSAAHRPPASAPHSPVPETTASKAQAIQIAIAAKRLNDLRENWLNPQEWTERVPEVTPLGMDKSPYPDRIVAKPSYEKDLAGRTLTKLYNQRLAWLDAAHNHLDSAAAAAYGWADYTPQMTDHEILKRLLALNLQRACAGPASKRH